MRIDGQGVLKKFVRLGGASLLKQIHGFDVAAVDAQVAIFKAAGHGRNRLALEILNARLVDVAAGTFFCRKLVILQRAIYLPLQLRDVAEIVQGVRIVGIDQVRLVEQLLGFFEIMFIDGLNAIAIEFLDRSEMTPLGNVDLQIARPRDLERDRQSCQCEKETNFHKRKRD